MYFGRRAIVAILPADQVHHLCSMPCGQCYRAGGAIMVLPPYCGRWQNILLHGWRASQWRRLAARAAHTLRRKPLMRCKPVTGPCFVIAGPIRFRGARSWQVVSICGQGRRIVPQQATSLAKTGPSNAIACGESARRAGTRP